MAGFVEVVADHIYLARHGHQHAGVLVLDSGSEDSGVLHECSGYVGIHEKHKIFAFRYPSPAKSDGFAQGRCAANCSGSGLTRKRGDGAFALVEIGLDGHFPSWEMCVRPKAMEKPTVTRLAGMKCETRR